MSALKNRLQSLGSGFAVLAAAIGVAVIVILVSALRSADADVQQAAPGALPVPVLTVSYQSDAMISEAYPGLISARRESDLGFERGGRIVEVSVDVGDQIEAGDTLARLDTSTLRAQIAAADAQTNEADAQLEIARATEERQRTLLERGHISQQRLDEVATNTTAAEARRAAAAAQANSLRAQLVLSEITAPFGGVVTARMADEGAIAAPGSPVIRLVENTSLEIRIGLPLLAASALNEGEVYHFMTNAGAIDARYRRGTGVVDVRTRTVTAIFDIESGTARAGEVARLQLETGISDRGFWVPTSALTEGRRGLWSVQTLVADGNGGWIIEPRVVETLRVEVDRAFVRGAVNDGDQIIASGLQRVTAGQSVIPAGE
ncbi:efflux RND transporter periplasmic adaptor subunit [Hyphobacterium sp. CCMP332]|jgi:membrane fusion protein, multidrug efflux system|uniref:efflux RND transporter periplasmic adaptor subunit n=1 Tax=Hyphobacterium sp. CCMP332 TaxID=2749086 RepID=UPI00164FB773|nr:efflux RND transporter periplasmic adaptor subunit [Hyphobacterium sp. CCMP332]QNL18437.1 efflux RND transporter periplasmic adaptor subunit [Hyphobacterium sp. CCMP332]